ncbi:MAG: branched-chain amino acid ABC transporter permease [Alphaproteobacteria bacterium]
MELFFQFALPGLTTGCIYALVALGFVLCANVSGLVNFAQGEYVMIGGLIGASMATLGLPLAATLAIATIAGAVLGVLQERLTLAPVRRAPAFIQITITLGVSVIVRGISLIVWGKDPLPMPGFTGDGVFTMLGAVLPIQNLWVWGATILMLGGLFWFLKFTPAGRAVRACSINMSAARLMGIDAERMTVMVFAVAGAAAALGGAIIAPIALGRYDAGLDYGLKGFIGAIIGGFRSPSMAVAGGIGIGLIEALAVGYISSGAKDAIAYGALLLFLLVQGGVFAFGRAHLTAGSR